MSDSQKCPNCKNQFDTFEHVPLLLPCNHTTCQQCLNASFKKQKQNQCPILNCQKISKIHPRNLKENQILMSQMIKEENQTEYIETAIQIVKEQITSDKLMLGEMRKKYSSLLSLIIKLAIKNLFRNTLNIIDTLQMDWDRDLKKLDDLNIMAHVLQEQGSVNFQIQIEQIINEEQTKIRKNQVKQEAQKLEIIRQQLENTLGTAFQNLELLVRK